MQDRFGAWLTSTRRVVAVTVLGTALCIVAALVFDSFSFRTGLWEWGPRPWNNVLIPLFVAPPLFYALLSKLRALSVAHHRLNVVATTDGLTSCLNRVAFSTLVDAYLAKFLDHKQLGTGALLVIDVDHFKNVNDTYGHEAGDRALQMIAEAIRSKLRDGDLVGRVGGEEFSVFLPRASAQQSRAVAERIRASVEQLRFAPHEKKHELTVSIGGAPLAGGASFSSLFREADQRLYEAKRTGRNRVILGPSESFVIE